MAQARKPAAPKTDAGDGKGSDGTTTTQPPTDEGNTAPAAEETTPDLPPPAEADPPAPDVDGDLCVACWPDGWPGQDEAASCGHGVWNRW